MFLQHCSHSYLTILEEKANNTLLAARAIDNPLKYTNLTAGSLYTAFFLTLTHLFWQHSEVLLNKSLSCTLMERKLFRELKLMFCLTIWNITEIVTCQTWWLRQSISFSQNHRMTVKCNIKIAVLYQNSFLNILTHRWWVNSQTLRQLLMVRLVSFSKIYSYLLRQYKLET